MNPAEIPTGYEHTWHHSAFARQALAGVCRRQQLLSVDTPLTPARLAEHFSACWPWANPHQNERLDEFGGALRQFRTSAVLAIMARDLAGTADFSETLESITALADMTIDAAYQAAMTTAVAQHGIPRDASGAPQDMMIVGMGKLGGRELNVSSDVDLIYVFSEDGETDASTPQSRSIDTSTFFTKVGRRIAALLGELTADADGRFAASLSIAGVQPGLHTFQVNGTGLDGKTRSVNVGVVVSPTLLPSPLPTELPATGDQPDVAVLLLAGMFMLSGVALVNRRRLS